MNANEFICQRIVGKIIMPLEYSITIYVSSRNEQDKIVELIRQKYDQYIQYISLSHIEFLDGKCINFYHERMNRNNPNHYWEYTADDYLKKEIGR